MTNAVKQITMILNKANTIKVVIHRKAATSSGWYQDHEMGFYGQLLAVSYPNMCICRQEKWSDTI